MARSMPSPTNASSGADPAASSADSEHWSPMPVVPWAQASTGRGLVAGAVGANTVAETATGRSSAVRDQWRTCHARAPPVVVASGRARMMSPGAPGGASPGSKNGSPVNGAKGVDVAGGPASVTAGAAGGLVGGAVVVEEPALASVVEAAARSGGTRLAGAPDAADPPEQPASTPGVAMASAASARSVDLLGRRDAGR